MSYTLIRELSYDATTAEVIKYKGNNNLSFSYTFTVNSTDNKVLLSIQFQEVNNSTKFFESWIIKEGDNQISFTGLSFGEAGTGFTPPSVIDYSVDSYVGKEWEKVNLVTIQYNTDFSRIVKLFNFSQIPISNNNLPLKILDQYRYDTTGAVRAVYQSENKYYYSYTFKADSLDNKVTFSIFYSEVNDKFNFFANWLMFDKKDNTNQLTFVSLPRGGEGGKTVPSITDYGVRNILGNKWKGAKIVRVDFTSDVRVVTVLG